MSGVWAWWVQQWPNVYPNLIASGICTVVVWFRVHLHLKRAEKHQAQTAARHARIERLLRRVLSEEDQIEHEEADSVDSAPNVGARP